MGGRPGGGARTVDLRPWVIICRCRLDWAWGAPINMVFLRHRPGCVAGNAMFGDTFHALGNWAGAGAGGQRSAKIN